MKKIKNLIFDVSSIINLWLGCGHYKATEKLFDSSETHNAKLWVAASSLANLDYVGRQILKRRGASAEEVKKIVPALFEDLFARVSILSTCGFRQKETYAKAEDFEDAQIAAASKALSGTDVCLVTENEDFDTLGEMPALSPGAALKWLENVEEDHTNDIQFIDLKAQQSVVREGLERNMNEVLGHGRYIMGPEIEQLEGRLADFTGSRHCISCSSGTDALLIALMALDIGPGDEVITVPYTWISTAEVIALLGAEPVFVDIRPDTMNIDSELIEPAITYNTRAIMPVGIYGQCADMTRINDIASRHNIPVIEDAAQSLGATHHGKRSCALSEIGCTSFFPSKPLGCYGDGGAVFTDDDALAEKMKQIRVHGQKVKHQHPLVGINGRLDSLQAAVLLEKLKVFPTECSLRREVAASYDEMFSDVDGLQTPYIAEGNESVYAQYTLLSERRDILSAKLKEKGVPSVSYYTTPLHLQGAFEELGYKKGDFPVTEEIASRCLSLPMSAYLSGADIERVAGVIKTA